LKSDNVTSVILREPPATEESRPGRRHRNADTRREILPSLRLRQDDRTLFRRFRGCSPFFQFFRNRSEPIGRTRCLWGVRRGSTVAGARVGPRFTGSPFGRFAPGQIAQLDLDRPAWES
jgi:hypothetical protein